MLAIITSPKINESQKIKKNCAYISIHFDLTKLQTKCTRWVKKVHITFRTHRFKTYKLAMISAEQI